MNPNQQPAPCGCGIDVHAHLVPEHFPSYIGNALPADWPSMAPAHECHRHVMISGKVYRTVSDRCWSAPQRLPDLQAMGLALQVVSPMPELFAYWMAPAAGQQLTRYLNDQTAAMVDEGGGQLSGMGVVPLQDIDLAIRELEYAVRVLGLRAVEIGSNINGAPVGAPQFDAFFAACVELDAAVFVHAVRPAGMERLVGPAALQQVLAYPTDVGLAAASVVTGGLLARQPKLRMAFSHGGGTLAALLPRLQQGWQVFPALRDTLSEPPVDTVRRLFYDTLVFDDAMLRQLLHAFGPAALMVGTDYPFNFQERAPLQRLESAGFDADTLQAISHGNARRFLGLARHKESE